MWVQLESRPGLLLSWAQPWPVRGRQCHRAESEPSQATHNKSDHFILPPEGGQWSSATRQRMSFGVRVMWSPQTWILVWATSLLIVLSGWRSDVLIQSGACWVCVQYMDTVNSRPEEIIMNSCQSSVEVIIVDQLRHCRSLSSGSGDQCCENLDLAWDWG